MKSITKTKLNNNIIEKMVKKAFGTEKKVSYIKELNDGYYNTAYSVNINDGEIKSVLKVAPNKDINIMRYEKNIMKTEVKVLELLSSNPNIPTPKLYFKDFEKELIPCDYFFMEEIEGQPWDHLKDKMSKEDNIKISKQLGEITRKINNITNDKFGYFEDRYNSWKEAFAGMMDSLIKDSIDYEATLPTDLKTIEKKTSVNLKYLENVKKANLVHWDLWEGNIFISDDNGEFYISGIIDCERAFWGDPLAEYNFSYVGKSDAFIEGYGTDLLVTEDQNIRRILYNIYWLMIMVVESIPRQYEDDSLTKWAYEELKKELEKL